MKSKQLSRSHARFMACVMASVAVLGLTQAPGAAQNTALPPATLSLGDSTNTYNSYGTGAGTSTFEVVPVVGQSFREALRLTTIKEPAQFWAYGATAPLIAPLHKGDVLWVSLWARRLTSRKESGEAQVEVALLQTVDAKEVRPLERLLSVGPKWTQFRLPFTVNNDSAIGQAKLGFRYGYGAQSLEIGGVQLLNYGTSVRAEQLPRSFIRYDGSDASAPWRKLAAQRIEKYRKGNFTVRVFNASGKPVPNALVQVRMKRHAFGWGTEIDETRITDSQNPDNVRYRQVLETYFNKVVIGNDMKWGRWIEPKRKQSVLAALPWLEKRHIAVRGHVMVWPSWQHLPKFLEASKNDPVALRKSVRDHIMDQTAAVNNRLSEWDVANETYKHHDLLDILGRDAMADWFRLAKAGAPRTKLFYNDYTMFQGGEGSQYFYDTVKSLKESGAPLDAIGEQGHFASSPPGIPSILATLDKFGKLGLPIQISEFDIDSDDSGLQADFMRDFTTAVFSHPSVVGVVQWGFWEKAHWIPRAALWDNDWNLTPHGKVWINLVTKTWWTNAEGNTKKDGSYTTRGFYGDYEVTVTQGGKSQTVPFSLSPTSKVLVVK